MPSHTHHSLVRSPKLWLHFGCIEAKYSNIKISITYTAFSASFSTLKLANQSKWTWTRSLNSSICLWALSWSPAWRYLRCEKVEPPELIFSLWLKLPWWWRVCTDSTDSWVWLSRKARSHSQGEGDNEYISFKEPLSSEKWVEALWQQVLRLFCRSRVEFSKFTCFNLNCVMIRPFPARSRIVAQLGTILQADWGYSLLNLPLS